MEQLKLAIQYLDKRALNTTRINYKLMKQFVKVLPVSEVNAVLRMVEAGEFQDFHDKMKIIGHHDFI